MQRNVRRALAVLVAAAGVSLGGVGIAGAAAVPQSGDTRATAREGDVTTCRSAGVPGDIVQVTAGTAGTVDITAAPDGYQVTGAVVANGQAYNRYLLLGDLPWNGLRAPLGSSGEPAQISHWFACGKPRTSAPTTTTTTTTTTSTTTTTAPATSDSSAPAVTMTSSTPVAQASDRDAGELAETGFDGGWYLLAGAGLLLAGAAALALSRARH
jgi:LPXTG-motif cell wall-anchored protein